MDASNEGGFYVRWDNLCWDAIPSFNFGPLKKSPRRILNQLNGFFLSGELVALMGPSGAGKSTLLECLCMKRNAGLTAGQMIVVGKPKVRIAIVPQHDDFLPQFTVTETIYYASRYKNRTYDISHRAIVRRVIQQLGLEMCQNNNITRCSGGQQKRVAIGQELVKRPNILMLDEPTSGLDSSSCYQTIQVLRQIINSSSNSSQPLTIVTTIHQPSAKVIEIFDRVYMMATGGRCAFNGPPGDILSTLSKVGATCPPFYNPVDHFIEVVSGDYGRNKAEKLVRMERQKRIIFDKKLESISSQTLKKAILYDPCPTLDHLWIHVQRSTLQLLRDPILCGLRLVLHILMALFYIYVFGEHTGRGDGCPTFNKQSLTSISVATAASLTKEEMQDQQRLQDNLLFIIYGALLVMFGAHMITVLTFPSDVKVLAKEYFNGWYTVPTYISGKITADAPFQIMCVVIYSGITYFMSHQPRSDYEWRFIVFTYSLITLSLLAQTQGLIVGAIFMNNLSASVFVGPLSLVPLFVYSGFTKRLSRMGKWLKFICRCNYFHYAVKTVYGSIFGFDRCKCNPNNYHLSDQDNVDYLDSDQVARSLAYGQGLAQNSEMSNNNDMLSSASSATGGQIKMPMSYLDTDQGSPDKEVYIGQFKCDDDFPSLVMHDLDIEDNDLYIGLAVMTVSLVILRLLVLLLVMYKVAR